MSGGSGRPQCVPEILLDIRAPQAHFTRDG
jgi:hypothetical protein